MGLLGSLLLYIEIMIGCTVLTIVILSIVDSFAKKKNKTIMATLDDELRARYGQEDCIVRIDKPRTGSATPKIIDLYSFPESRLLYFNGLEIPYESIKYFDVQSRHRVDEKNGHGNRSFLAGAAAAAIGDPFATGVITGSVLTDAAEEPAYKKRIIDERYVVKIYTTISWQETITIPVYRGGYPTVKEIKDLLVKAMRSARATRD